MRNTLLALGIAAATTLPAQRAAADTTLEFDAAQGGMNTVMVKDGRVSMATGNPPQAQISLYDSRAGTFTIVNPEQRTYMVLDNASIQAQAKQVQAMRQQMMAQVQERMKQMPPEQRQLMEQQMARMGMGPTAGTQPTPNFSTRKTGQTESINGIACEVYESYRDDQPVGKACVASAKALGVSEDDYRTLKNMFSFTQSMAKEFAASSGTPTPPNPLSVFDKTDGLPVKISGPSGNLMTLATVSNNAVSAENFQVPAGYRQTDLSQMMGGAGPRSQGSSTPYGRQPSPPPPISLRAITVDGSPPPYRRGRSEPGGPVHGGRRTHDSPAGGQERPLLCTPRATRV